MSEGEQGRALDAARHTKPLDFGADGVIGSVDASGRLIALNTYHEQVGFVTLTTADPFPESQRYNPEAVRHYRAGLALLDGFGPQFASPVTGRAARLAGSGATARLVPVLYHVRLKMPSATRAAAPVPSTSVPPAIRMSNIFPHVCRSAGRPPAAGPRRGGRV